ncbi:unnamed protein product [Fraxinus pennsylvanica]|uniref:C3H1-type domain-containing protein n=1 Tax=Fraxinus pennsylvanica TaxID=56036 RepID=A0AAD2EBT7_9LAMI|nr:unnamed protein product [Fraxinus pennsylvanica]
MENLHSSLKASKHKSLNYSDSSINIKDFVGRRYQKLRLTAISDPYASDGSKSPSPPKYLHSTSLATAFNKYFSPLAAIENLESPPVKLEKDVLVMDESSVRKFNKGGRSGGIRGRSLPISSESGGCREIESITGRSFDYRTEMCPFWEDSGICRFGSKCQFAHGKEELRPIHFSGKNKFEAPSSKSSNSSGGSGSSHGSKFLFVHHKVKPAVEFLSPPLPIPMALPTLSTKVEQTSGAVGRTRTSITAFTNSDWTPLDDGIAVSLSSGSFEENNPSKEDVDAYIRRGLYVIHSRKRLPVFLEFCQE